MERSTSHAAAGERRRKRSGGFTLVEVMVATVTAGIILASILSAVVSFSRMGVAMGAYSEMEGQRQELLAVFSRDVRRAEGAVWGSSQSLQLTVGSTTVTYRYDANADTVERILAGQPARVLARGVQQFSFEAYDRDSTRLPNLQQASATCKMIQVTFELVRGAPGATQQTTITASPRYILRNKVIAAP